MAAAYAYHPYCGAPPSPESVLTRWNLDPVLLAALAAVVVAYIWMNGRRGRWGLPSWRRTCFYAGWGVTALVLISPLCALGVSLFSARVGQHMILATVAAPLVAMGRPFAFLAQAGEPAGRRDSVIAPAIAPLAFALALWCWHAPGPYAATFDGALVYWLTHLTSFGAALWLWSTILAEPARRPGLALAAGGFTGVQMGMLGAVITFAPRPLYAPHLATAEAWGLSPLADQQLGGVLMWAPAGLVTTAVVIAAFATVLIRPEPARGAAPSAA